MPAGSPTAAIVRKGVVIVAAAAFATPLLHEPNAHADQLPVSEASTRRVFDLPIANGKAAVNAGTIKVKKGDELELRWSSDRPMSLHLHGYDIETRVDPRSPAIMSFKANLAGRFPVSEHREGGRERTVLYLEVHP